MLSRHRAKAGIAGLLVGAGMLTGCGWFGSLFPDKQKEYRYSKEIPALEIPPDLDSATIEEARRAAPAGDSDSVSLSDYERGKVPYGKDDDAAAEADESTDAASEGAPGTEGGEAAAENAESEPGQHAAQHSIDSARIEVPAPFDRAWSQVGKSLGRLEVEVSDQNRSDGLYYVYYAGAEADKSRKPGFWGRLLPIFAKDSDTKEKAYRVHLVEQGEKTLVYVLDEQDKPQESGPGFELLRRLNDQIGSMSESDGEADSDGKAKEPDNSNER